MIGDAIARLLEFAGHEVEREYYFNDAGGQMDRFGASVEARYLELLGRDAAVPEDGYHGEYVRDYARGHPGEEGPGLADLDPEDAVRAPARRGRPTGDGRDPGDPRAVRRRVRHLRLRGLARATRARSAEAIERLRAAGFVYDAEGAVWFRSTAFGDDKDRSLVRSNGVHTYFAADCAYLIDKFSRGFDHLIYVWGADHHGDVVRVRGAAEALGFDPTRVEMVLYQFVTFLRGGEPVKMSKRAGTFVTLDELIDEVGTDAARFHLLLFSNDHPMNFDIEVVKRQTMDNPVYYVQYGHARIASILRTAPAARGRAAPPIDEVDLSLLAPRGRARPPAGARRGARRRRLEGREPTGAPSARPRLAGAGRSVPPLLHGVPGGVRGRGAHPGAAVALPGDEAGAGEPAGPDRGLGAGADGPRG